MKKLIFISLAIIAFMAVSCTDDYTDPANLSGTSWICTSFTDPAIASETENIRFLFESTTKVEFRTKLKDGTFNSENYTYSISDKSISLFEAGETVAITIGTIDGKKMSFVNPNDNSSLVFTKE